MIRILVLALLAVCAPAFAASAGVTNFAPYAYQSGASSFVVAAGSNGTPIALAARSVTSGTAGEFLIRDMFNAAGPAGNLPLTATRTVSGLGAARAILGQAAKGFTPVAIGMTAYDLMQAYRMRPAGSSVEVDPGTDPSSSVVVQYRASWSDYVGPWVSSKAGALSALMGVLPKTHSWSDCTGSVSNTVVNSTTGAFTIVQTACTNSIGISGGSGTYNRTASYNQESRTINGCPSIVDALTGQSYVPGVSGDGKCMTGRYETRSVEAAAGTLAAAMTVAAVKDYVNSPASQAEPVPESKPMEVTGPATQVGVPKTVTTTSPTGTISETRTPTYTYNYAGNTVNYSTVNQTVTNITNNEGTTETTTETKPEDIQKGDCELYPESVGCLDMGEVPDEEVPEEEREVDISPEDVDLPSGCPADVALPGGRTLSYASACAAAEDVAPLVIAAGVLSALLIAVAAIRGS